MGDRRLAARAWRFGQPHLRFEELSLAIDDGHQHDGHVEELSHKTRQPVERLLGRRVEQPRSFERTQTIGASQLAVRSLRRRRQRGEFPHGIGDEPIGNRGSKYRRDAPAREFLTSTIGGVPDDGHGQQRRTRAAAQLLRQAQPVGYSAAKHHRGRQVTLGALQGLDDRPRVDYLPAIVDEHLLQCGELALGPDEDYVVSVSDHPSGVYSQTAGRRDAPASSGAEPDPSRLTHFQMEDVMARRKIGAALLGLFAIVSWPGQAAAQVDPVAAAVGQNVRVSLTNGGRETGRLLSLSAAEVVIRTRGTEVRLPLDRVRSVTRLPDPIRDGALLGAAIGAVAGLQILKCEPGVNDDCPRPHSWWYLDAPVGAGIGAIIGALIDRIKVSKDGVVYRAPVRTSRFLVAPVITPTRRGVALVVWW